MSKRINWGHMGPNIDGERLNHLRFGDNLVLIADRFDDAVEIPQDSTQHHKKRI